MSFISWSCQCIHVSVTMAKKKKKAGRADARGYSTTSSSFSAKQRQQPSRKVAVSATDHDNLTSLLTDLKGKESASLPSSNVGRGSTCTSGTSGKKQKQSSYLSDRPGHTAREYPIDPTDKKFIKKVGNIHDTLIELSFTEQQIESALRALGAAKGSDFDLDLTLDWLCLNLPSEDLPSLFIEQDVQMCALEEGGISVHVVKGGNGTSSKSSEVPVYGVDVGLVCSERESANELIDMFAAKSLSATQNKKMESSLSFNENDEDDKARKRQLLAQYQYEEESEAEEDNACNFAAESANYAEGDQAAEENETTPEEKRLAELERLIEEDTAILNDEGAMYMMSKYEVADLKKRIQKVQGQARGLRGKVAKTRAAREKVEKEESAALYKEEEGKNVEDDAAAAVFSLFGDGDAEQQGSANGIFSSVSTPDADTKTDELPPLQHIGRMYSTISTTEPSIPKGWTGTTPKKVLQDYCMKQKLPRPQFSKLAQTSSGCKIVVRKQPMVQKSKRTSSEAVAKSEEESLIIENSGPFFSFGDSQQYLATEALYELSPSLPFYRIFPPIFRDIWIAWQKEEKEEQIAETAKQESRKRHNVEQLINSIYEAYKEHGTNISNNRSNDLQEDKQSVQEEKKNEQANVVDDRAGSSLEGVGNAASSSHRDAQPTLLGKKLCREFERKASSSAYKAMLQERKALPIYAHRKSLLDTVRKNPVTVLCASTGAGKSTNCPLFLLEEALEIGLGDKVNIICTQPRRVAAISVAERVADELVEGIGGRYIGYHIRGESRKSSETKLVFCTTGVILRR